MLEADWASDWSPGGSRLNVPGRDVVAFCPIGERSSHTWFARKYLLGFDHASNYDGSWTERETWSTRLLRRARSASAGA